MEKENMEAKEQQIQLMEKAEIENIQKELMEKNIKAEMVQEMQDYFNNVVEEEEMDIMVEEAVDMVLMVKLEVEGVAPIIVQLKYVAQKILIMKESILDIKFTSKQLMILVINDKCLYINICHCNLFLIN